MSPIIVKTIQLFLSLSILIVLHELGHFIPAKIFKTRVEKFFLFFDVKYALFKKKIGETVYGIGWLPLGGYVKISGMIDESMDKEQMAQPAQPWEFRSKPAWQRLIIMIGGVTVNLLLGFFIYIMILFTWGTPEVRSEAFPNGFTIAEELQQYGFREGDNILTVDGETPTNLMDLNRMLLIRGIEEVEVKHLDGTSETIALPDSLGTYLYKAGATNPINPRTPSTLDSVPLQMPAAMAGLQAGDKVISINGEDATWWHQFTSIVRNSEGPLDLVYERSGVLDTVQLAATPDRQIGVYVANTFNADGLSQRNYSLAEAIPAGIEYGYWTLHDYVASLKFLFTKKGATEIGGFGTIAQLFPETWNWQGFWMSTALISIILAFMNILPIPALDGGHVMFLLYEMISGRKPSDKFMEYAQMVGFFILIGLLLYANGNDIYRAIFD
ncbi:RIP metalloprotease RseP [Robertkochia sediminum]|uniref:RIP metalloprotease RseP n=1 Tax=Robertkochia sediminum TaxID=2785326 RepID=UPI0019337DED|nr:RIP metalloprotease RseP [Robertkochia sediminum]MBL7473792.1 RIP metalloprotease RseP [Robertkochia sediminum]